VDGCGLGVGMAMSISSIWFECVYIMSGLSYGHDCVETACDHSPITRACHARKGASTLERKMEQIMH
jgi:hypothetical protein